MENQIEIFKTNDNQTIVEVKFGQETVWLNRQQMADLFCRDIKTIGKHINNIFNEGELNEDSVVAKFATTAIDGKTYQMEHYNLDVIISVGYRVKSRQGIHFRQWATQRLKDYLIQGYAINEKRLKQKRQEVEYLKTGIRILSRAIEKQALSEDSSILSLFSKGLMLLDAYDHEKLDDKGNTTTDTVFPDCAEYIELIRNMNARYESGVFAKPRDESFYSSINQIKSNRVIMETIYTLHLKNKR